MGRQSYTRYPRPILWLVRGGAVTIGGEENDSRPRFKARVEPFYIGKYPVTNEQFEAFDPGFERSSISAGGRGPATGVSFEMANAYCEWYAGVSRKPMRLPTEVEWEAACRGGSAGRTFFGDAAAGDFAWHAGNSWAEVGRLDAKKANDLGLYGMLGGVWEWTRSLARPYPLSPPFGEDSSVLGRRVLRGGSVRIVAAELTCSLRRAEDPAARHEDVGFRIAKSFR